MTRIFLSFLSATFLLLSVANAQFQFFEQMFNGQGQQQQRHQEPQNVPSDSNWYQQNFENGRSTRPPIVLCSPILSSVLEIYRHGILYLERKCANLETAHCSNYLCPDTLACVHFPHHCPCAHPTFEEKFELGDGKAICISKGGFKAGEAARKVELARKGLL